MRITAEGIFDVTLEDMAGAGNFSIAHSALTDFQFSMLGFTWDEADADCVAIAFGNAVDVIQIAFSDAQGSGLLTWSFTQGVFGITLRAGDVDFIGTSENGPVTGAFSEFDAFAVAEPGTALLLALALVIGCLSGTSRRSAPSR